MRYIFIILLSIIFFNACSIKTKPNNTYYKMSNAFKTYQKDFLSSYDILAKNDLKRAKNFAKQNADIDALATIYLGECALNISVGKDMKCQRYLDIKDLLTNDLLDAYYHLITLKLKKNDLKIVPKDYVKFAKYLYNKDYTKAYSEILEMPKVSSQLIASSLIKTSLTKHQIKSLLKIASFNGYKKSSIFWLKELKNKTKDIDEQKRIEKKILILQQIKK